MDLNERVLVDVGEYERVSLDERVLDSRLVVNKTMGRWRCAWPWQRKKERRVK